MFGMMPDGFGGFFIYRIKQRCMKMPLAYAPAWVRAFVLFSFAYTLHKYGFSVTPNLQLVIDFVKSLWAR